MTKADFSRQAGVTRAAVSIALSRGRIRAEPDGSMNPKRAENAAYLTTVKRQRRDGAKTGVKHAQRVVRSGGHQKPKEKTRAKVPEGGGQLQLDGETYGMAELRKKVEDANAQALKNAERRGQLVERTAVESIFNNLIAVLTQQTLAIPQRCAPTLCGELGVDEHEKVIKCQTFLDKEIRAGIDLQKQLMLDYIAEMEAADEED